jgi:hypothetical protein
MQCDSCKYFAVPLSEEEKHIAHCPGANPYGDDAQKVCTLRLNPDFDVIKLNPEKCHYYFPKFFRFR